MGGQFPDMEEVPAFEGERLAAEEIEEEGFRPLEPADDFAGFEPIGIEGDLPGVEDPTRIGGDWRPFGDTESGVVELPIESPAPEVMMGGVDQIEAIPIDLRFPRPDEETVATSDEIEDVTGWVQVQIVEKPSVEPAARDVVGGAEQVEVIPINFPHPPPDEVEVTEGTGRIEKGVRGVEAEEEQPPPSDANDQYLILQRKLQEENQQFTTHSNVVKASHDKAKNSINNIR